MREAGKILSEVHDCLADIIVPGITTKELDRRAFEIIHAHGCTPSFLNYNGFPASICASVNEEVIHGIPDKKRVLNTFTKRFSQRDTWQGRLFQETISL